MNIGSKGFTCNHGVKWFEINLKSEKIKNDFITVL